MVRQWLAGLNNRLSRTGAARVWLLSAYLATFAVGISLGPLGGIPALSAPAALPWWVFAAGFAAAEIFIVRIQLRRDTHSFSLSEIPLVLALFFLPPQQVVLAQVVGASVALLAHRRSPPTKFAFNVSNLAFEAGIAGLLFHMIVPLGPDPLGPNGWTAALLAALVANAVGLSTIAAAIYLSAGRPHGLRRLYVTGIVASFCNTTLALAAITITWDRPWAVWLPAVMAATLFLAYRAYGSLRQQHEGLEMLYESTRLVQQSLDVQRVVSALLSQARTMFRAERAELLIFPNEGETALLSIMRGDGDIELMTPVVLDPTEGLWARVAAEGRAVCLSRPIASERLRNYFGRRGIRDAMVAPLRGQDLVLGTLTVANNRADASTFTPEELKLFETLANHASISLQNGRLVDRLRRQAAEHQHQALHDPLTGMGNRRLFREGIESAIGQAQRAGTAMAVLIMDLDRFKEVNDTLGHRNGDRLLQEIARRLLDSLEGSATIARLSGDEFAVLLDSAGAAAAAETANRILSLLDEPLEIDDLTLQIGGSIGIALFPEHGTDADTLVQRADVAMYLAKEGGTGYEFYSPERDEYSPARLALVSELRRAIENRELSVVYQPIADLRTGRIEGAEALVRWEHPTRGLLLPDQFIPMAEHTGLIRPLTLQVLEMAVKDCRTWRDAGHDLSVSVNLSVRGLLDQGLPMAIQRILDAAELPHSALTLEVTETAIVTDPERSEAVLSHLSEAGIRIAVDDFGTGYSSLSRLKRLPVSVLKIDRSFVMAMTTDDNDLAIVRSTIELARNLGLQTVAEGVETSSTWDLLAELGCDSSQGYFVGRPMPTSQLTELLMSGWRDRSDSRANLPLSLRLVQGSGVLGGAAAAEATVGRAGASRRRTRLDRPARRARIGP